MRRFTLLFIPACLAVAISAATITGNSTGGPPVKQPPYTVSLTPPNVEHLGAGSSAVYGDLNTLRGAYNQGTEWLFGPGSPDAPGTFNVLQYDPWIAQNAGGANFSVIYDDGVAAPRDDYNWIQIAHFHNWGNAGSGDKVDSPYFNSPFYGSFTPLNLPTLTTGKFPGVIGSGDIWLKGPPNYPDTRIQNPAAAGNVPAGDLLFLDQPYCSLSCADSDGKAYAYFDLFLVTFTYNGLLGSSAGGQVNILDGMRWGVEITKDPVTFDDPGKVPEPGTYVLIGSGLVLVCLARRRSQRPELPNPPSPRALCARSPSVHSMAS